MTSSTILRISLLGSLLLVLSVFLLYRGTDWPLGTQAVEAFGALVLLLAINSALFFCRGSMQLQGESSSQKSIALGLSAGLLWTTEISMNNILTPGLPLRDILDDLFWIAIALILLGASITWTYQTHNIRTGIRTGLWSGLSSGAVACLTGLIFVVIGMPLLLHDPLNLAEWSARGATSGTPNMAVYVAYQTLAGALGHLVVLGAIMGGVLGLLGGALGKVGCVLVRRMRTKNT
ncbi:MAG TPA: hypothetical protein VF458_07120 [Ktedonobacteraceae bacterium]